MRQRRSDLSGLMALLLFAVFAVCILSVLLTGAKAYSGLTQRDQNSYDSRTAAQYLTTRVRQGDTQGGVWVGTFDGQPTEQGDTLFFTEEVEGETYATRLYVYDGQLRELFSDLGGDFSPADGQDILPAQSLTATQEGNCLTLCLTDDSGEETTLSFALRSGEVTP